MCGSDWSRKKFKGVMIFELLFVVVALHVKPKQKHWFVYSLYAFC
jgi:hypothetical protein